MRLLYLLPLLLFSCVVAALYGALHNQISYSVSAAYFHEFKFVQFHVDPALHGRSGASLVGALASWWMGLILGLPLFLVALFIRGDGLFWRSYMKAAVIVVGVALLVGLGALAYAMLAIGPDTLPGWMAGREVSEPVAFARAGIMHNFSYLGGLVGAGMGLGYLVAVAVLSRQTP
jgi:hypothetical protein